MKDIPTVMQSKPWLVLFANHTAMLVLSLVLMAAISRGDLSRYGIRLPDALPLRQVVTLGLAIGIVSTVVASLVPGKDSPLATELTFIQTVVFLWLWASVCEEVLIRGLVQTSLAPLDRFGILLFGIRLSGPVIIAAVAFALLHFAQVAMGADLRKAIVVVLFALALGLVAGYYREATSSLVPAIAVHMFANVGGSVAEYLLAFTS